MKIPNSVKIGPYTYTVELHDKVLDDHNEELYGHIIYGPQQIKIQSGLSTERTAAIFFHESLYGLDEVVSIGLSEKQVERLAPALLSFLLDNHLLRDDDPAPAASGS